MEVETVLHLYDFLRTGPGMCTTEDYTSDFTVYQVAKDQPYLLETSLDIVSDTATSENNHDSYSTT